MLAPALLLFASCAQAAEAPAVSTASAVLDNGLRIVAVRSSLADVVATVLTYRAGSDESPAGFPGTAHAQEHMMFRGSPGLSGPQLADILAALGGEFNAETGPTATQYTMMAPAEDLDLVLRVEAERMKGALDEPAQWDKERGAIEQEIAQDLSDPGYVAYMKLQEVLYAGSPYAVDGLGTQPSFDKTTAAMLKAFDDAWYAPNDAVLVVAGDLDPGATIAKARALFGPLPARVLPPRPKIDFRPVKKQTLRLSTDRPSGTLMIAFRFPGTDSPDYAAATLLADALASQRGELYALVVEGAALSADASYDPFNRAGIGAVSVGFPAGADAEALARRVEAVLRRYAEKGVPAELVQAARKRELAGAELARNSVSGLADQWAQAVAIEGRRSPEDDLDAVGRVTPADVDRLAKSLLDTEHAVTAVLTPKAGAEAVAGEAKRGKEALAGKPEPGVELPDWARGALSKLEAPRSHLAPQDVRLSNGLRVVIQPESVSRTVGIYGKIRTEPDLETPPGKEGVDEVLENLFNYGTQKQDRLAFEASLDALGAFESAGASFEIQALSGDFDRAVELLAENERSPAFPEKAFEVVRGQVAAETAGRLQSPGYRRSRALRERLFPKKDPVQREATPQSVRGLTLADIKEYYSRTFRPDLATIVVIGDVDPAVARAAVEKYFGGWRASGPPPETRLPPAPNNPPAVVHVPDASRVQDEAVLAQTLGVTRTSPDFYPLELGDHVLGGAFYATRLYHDLREEAGLVYYVESDLDAGENRSVYEVRFACDPGKVATARAKILQELRRMRETEPSPRELTQAKALLLREIPLGEASVEGIALGWLSRSARDLPLDEPLRAAGRYLELQGKDVRAAWARWLRPDDFVQITLGPSPH